MPGTKIVKNIVDKLRKISSKVTITATSRGTFSMLGKTTSASIEVHFKDLIVKKLRDAGLKQIPFYGCYENSFSFDDSLNIIHTYQISATSPSASVCVEIKKISQFLTCDSINASIMVCNIVADHMLHMSLSHNGFALNYYMMAVEE